MKKWKVLLCFAVGLCVGAVGGAALLYSVKTGVDWRIYLEETLIPTAVSALFGASMVYVMGKPALGKLLRAIGLFEGATKNISTTAESGESNAKTTQELAERIEAAYKKYAAESEKTGKTLESVKEMLLIAFCNTPDLVRSGYAKEIAKIGEGKSDAGEK